jgi:predicted transcriptional regulator
MARIALSLDDDIVRELAQLAHEAQVSQEALAREAIERLLQARHAPPVPRFARRLGPLALPGASR